MRKSFYAVLIVLLSLVGANSWADKLDNNVKKASIETNDKTGNENYGGRQCASTREK